MWLHRDGSFLPPVALLGAPAAPDGLQPDVWLHRDGSHIILTADVPSLANLRMYFDGVAGCMTPERVAIIQSYYKALAKDYFDVVAIEDCPEMRCKDALRKLSMTE